MVVVFLEGYDFVARALGEPLEVLLCGWVIRNDLKYLAGFDLVDVLPCLKQGLGAVQAQTVKRSRRFDIIVHTQYLNTLLYACKEFHKHN